LPGHEVTTVPQAGWTGLKNDDLIQLARDRGFDVLVTSDRNLQSQQNIAVSGIAVVLVKGSRMVDINAQADALLQAVAAARPGTVSRVEPA